MRSNLIVGGKYSILSGTGGGGGGGSLTPKIINVPADYPDIFEANRDIGRHYYIGGDPSVTDNDPTKTNTGETYLLGQDLLWNGLDAYFVVGDNPLFNQYAPIYATSDGQTAFVILGPPAISPDKGTLVIRGVTYAYGEDFIVSGNTIDYYGDYAVQIGDLIQYWYNANAAAIAEIGFTAKVTAPLSNVTGDDTDYIIVFDAVDKDSGAPGLPELYHLPGNGTAIVPVGAYVEGTTLFLGGISDDHAELTIRYFDNTLPSVSRIIDPRPLRFNLTDSGGGLMVGDVILSDFMPLYFSSQRAHSIRLKVSGAGGAAELKTVSVLPTSYFSMYKQ